jgi:hypothetical protein
MVLSNKKINREKWNNFKSAVGDKHGTERGYIALELENAIEYWTKVMRGEIIDRNYDS